MWMDSLIWCDIFSSVKDGNHCTTCTVDLLIVMVGFVELTILFGLSNNRIIVHQYANIP